MRIDPTNVVAVVDTTTLQSHIKYINTFSQKDKSY